MVATASDLRAAGVDLPLLVGGAALSRNFVDRNIAPAYGGTVAYAHDAMSGLELAKRVVDAEKRLELEREATARRAQLASVETARKALLLKERLDDLKQECREGAMKARAVYQFFRARGEGNDLLLLRPDGSELTRFTFPRQEGEDGLCLADYVGQDDSVCLFVTTAGEGIRARAELAKKNGDFLKSHLLQALALETAEAYAELLHSSLRSQWGFPDPLETTMLDRFKANYHGKRYSFGYPACPSLDDQQILFRVLQPKDIG